MNSRQAEILIMIRDNRSPVTLCNLADLFNVSRRTIQNDIKAISYELEKVGISLLRTNNNGLTVARTPDSYHVINKLIYEFDACDNALNPDERIQLLFSLLLFHQGYITISNLSNKLSVSRNTILSDLNRLRKQLDSTQLVLLSNSRFGIKLSGDEKQIRDYAISNFIATSDKKMIINAEQYHYMSMGNRFLKIRSFEESKLIYDQMQHFVMSLNNAFSERAFILILCYLELAIERTKIGRNVSINDLQLESIYGTREFKDVHELMEEIGNALDINFPVDEVGFLTLVVFSAGFVNTDKNNYDENYAEIQMIVCTLIDKVANYLDINVSHDVSLYRNLVYHIKPAIYRLRKKIYQKNPLIDEIKKNYKDIFDAVKSNIRFIENLCGSKMSDDEIGYITIHFLSYIERCPNDDYVPNVLIVCDYGIGTSNLLATRLEALYDVNIIDEIALYELDDVIKEAKIDYVISTLDVNIYRKNIPVIKVTPFINDDDIKKLSGVMKRKKQKIKIDEKQFIDEISKFCQINDQEKLIAGFEKRFSFEFRNTNWKGKVLMLKDVVAKEMIEVGYEARDWEAAVRESGRLLMEGGCINQDYIESMVNTVKTMGTYIVISKGIALPHSRSGDGAFKVGISILKLAKPVVFGHPENDPVDLIFGLSSVDSTSHLTALQDLSATLIDQKKVAYLRRENDVDKIFAFIAKESECNDRQ